jgi:hypothetical protein
MTDKEKVKKFLKSFDVPILEYDKSIEIDNWTEKANDKIVTGPEWAGCEFNFDENGKFLNIELTGD